MFDRISGRARMSMARARQACERLGHEAIGTEHVLLGLLGDREGWAAAVLRDVGADPGALAADVEAASGPRARSREDEAPRMHPFTLGAKRTLEFALDEADTAGHAKIGTAHLLVGLVRTGDGPAADGLLSRGATIGRLRDALRRVLAAMPDEDAGEGPAASAGWAHGASDDLVSTLRAARDAANARGHGFVGTDHLLLALLDSQDPAAKLLTEDLAGASPETLRRAIDRLRAPGRHPLLTASVPFSPSARRVLEGTEAEARALGHAAFGVGHLLLSLLDVPESLGVTALRSVGVDLDALRAQVRAGLIPRS